LQGEVLEDGDEIIRIDAGLDVDGVAGVGGGNGRLDRGVLLRRSYREELPVAAASAACGDTSGRPFDAAIPAALPRLARADGILRCRY
jgi:hypothetical protein